MMKEREGLKYNTQKDKNSKITQKKRRRFQGTGPNESSQVAKELKVEGLDAVERIF